MIYIKEITNNEREGIKELHESSVDLISHLLEQRASSKVLSSHLIDHKYKLMNKDSQHQNIKIIKCLMHEVHQILPLRHNELQQEISKL